MTNNSIFTRVLALMICLVMLVGTLTACFNEVDGENHTGTTTNGEVTTKPTTTTTTTTTTGDVVEDEPTEDPVDPNVIFSASTNISSDSLIYGTLANDVVIGGTEVGALVPADVKVEAGASSLALSVKKVDEELLGDALSALDVHINGIALDNTVPMIVKLGAILEAGLGATELKLYHTENGVDNLMTRVNSPADFAIHNQYYYNAETGEVTIYIASFSVISAVKSVADVWDGTSVAEGFASGTGTEADPFIIETAAQLVYFRNQVDAGNTFEGKTVKLGVDIDLKNIAFDPIGFGYYKDEKRVEENDVLVSDTNTVFLGTFDGGNHTIYNLYENCWELDPDKTNYGTYTYSTAGAGLFASVKDATIKNIAINGAEVVFECVDMGVLVGYAQGECHFENIVISNAKIANYNRYTGGLVGEVSYGVDKNEDGYTHTFKNITIDSTVTVSGLWGSFGCGMGGVIGGKWGTATVLMENVVSAPVMDVYNDVVSAYQWYAFRGCGMLIGHTEEPYSDGRTSGNATATFLTCKNVNVYYGDWVDYNYYEFENQDNTTGQRYPWVRAEEGEYCEAFSNIRYGVPTHNGVKVSDLTAEELKAVATDYTKITFDQLYGADRGMYGTNKHDGVNVSYSSPKTFYIENNLGWKNLTLHYTYEIGEETWTTIPDGVELFESNGVYRVDLPVGAVSFTITADGGYTSKVFIVSELTEKDTLLLGTVTCTHETTTTITENVVNATCTANGSYESVTKCAECDAEISRETITTEKVNHTFDENNKCICGAIRIITTETTTTTDEIIFELGENGSASHKDGSTDKTTYTETNGGYTLNITSGSKMYPSSFDEKGNSAIKLGTEKKDGSFTFDVPKDVNKVIIYIAKYKDNKTEVKVNDTTYTLTKNSNDGEYDVIEVDTTTNKTVTVTTLSGGYRAMVNSITFVVYTITTNDKEMIIPAHDCNENIILEGKDATCTEAGLTVGAKCDVCGATTIEQETISPLNHDTKDNPYMCARENCDYVELPEACEVTIQQARWIAQAIGNGNRTDVKYIVTGIIKNTLSVTNGATIIEEDGSQIRVDAIFNYGGTIKYAGFANKDGFVVDSEITLCGTIGSSAEGTITLYAAQLTSHSVTAHATCQNAVICDICGEEVEAQLDHADINNDGFCDNGCGQSVVTHTCESKCNECGKCTDKECEETVCAVKCEGHTTEPRWEKVDLADITSTDVIVITWTKDGTTWALSSANGSSAAPTAVVVTVNGNQLNGDIAENIKWNISNSNGNLIIYPNGTTATWLYCTSTNNGVRVGTNANKVFTIDATSGYLKNTATSRYLGVYTTNPDIRCYTSTGTNINNQTLAFYVWNGGTSGGDTGHTHSYTGNVTTAATCTTDGVMTYTCTCGEGTYTEVIEATGHSYANGSCTVCGVEDPNAGGEKTTATLSFANKTQRTSFSTTKQVWEQNGIVFTNEKSSSTNNIADYANPVRLYANSKITITALGNITKIVFDCNSGSYATALKNSIGTVSGATVTVSSDKVTVEFTSAVESFTIAKLSGQVRMDSITVTYTK